MKKHLLVVSLLVFSICRSTYGQYLAPPSISDTSLPDLFEQVEYDYQYIKALMQQMQSDNDMDFHATKRLETILFALLSYRGPFSKLKNLRILEIGPGLKGFQLFLTLRTSGIPIHAIDIKVPNKSVAINGLYFGKSLQSYCESIEPDSLDIVFTSGGIELSADKNTTKKKVIEQYRLIFEYLKQGGLFINLQLVTTSPKTEMKDIGFNISSDIIVDGIGFLEINQKPITSNESLPSNLALLIEKSH